LLCRRLCEESCCENWQLSWFGQEKRMTGTEDFNMKTENAGCVKNAYRFCQEFNLYSDFLS